VVAAAEITWVVAVAVAVLLNLQRCQLQEHPLFR
jgi:hypothetical protein